MKTIYVLLAFFLLIFTSCSREDYIQPENLSKNHLISPLQASGNSVKRPLSDFLNNQGTTAGFLPPVPDYFGWGSELEDGTIRLLAMDYLGFSNEVIIDQGGSDLGTRVSGSITELPLADGRAQVKVNLIVQDALLWVTDVDFAAGGDFASDPLIMGARPADVLNGATPALGSGAFQFDFINTAPGAPLPDVLRAVFEEIEVPGFELLQIKISASGSGLLHTTPLHVLPWEDGDAGKMTVSFNDIYFNNPSANSRLARNFGTVGAGLNVKKIGN